MRERKQFITEYWVELDNEDMCEAIAYWLNEKHDIPVNPSDIPFPGPDEITVYYKEPNED